MYYEREESEIDCKFKKKVYNFIFPHFLIIVIPPQMRNLHFLAENMVDHRKIKGQ
jgi:hypothetical protein